MARVIPLRDFNLSLAKRLAGDGQIGHIRRWSRL